MLKGSTAPQCSNKLNWTDVIDGPCTNDTIKSLILGPSAPQFLLLLARTQAAGQGHADANFYLGLMHHKGLGLRRKNAQKAFQYYALASQGGHVQAMYNAAMMQLAGKGTTK